FERVYKPYEIKLDDVRAEFYEGTSQARDYSSDIVLTDETNNEKVETTIWMNNPLRYGGETLYQQSYGELADNTEYTALQVVSNRGWMTPYVACMIVAIGMLAQFLMALSRFLNRRTAAAVAAAGDTASMGDDSLQSTTLAPALSPGQVPASRGMISTWFPLAATLLITLWLGSKMVVRSTPADDHNLYQFGQIRVRDEGRLKPIDSVARNTLRFLSGKTEFVDASEKKQPAIRFLLDTMVPAGTYTPPEGDGIEFPLSRSATHRVFKLTNFEAQKFLGLEKRSEYVEKTYKHLYSFEELLPTWGKLQERMRDLQQELTENKIKSASKRDLKLRELHRKLNHYYSLSVSFDPRFLLSILSTEVRRAQETGDRTVLADFMEAQGDLDKMTEFLGEIYAKDHAILLIPNQKEESEKWIAYPAMEIQISQNESRSPDEESQALKLTQLFGEIVKSYGDRNEDPSVFNEKVQAYLGTIAADKPASLEIPIISYEAYFNKTEIYYYAAAASIFAFILGTLSWLGWTEPLRRSAFWILLILLIVHTYGLTSRIYISGRPPVTNLYSSAIFIGWGAIAIGLLLEWIYPIGISVTISAAMSFFTLLIAHFLSIGGDTIGVLQAVLDTQFWLATHVVCITFGYTTTFVAGFLGLAYLIRGMFTPTLTASMSKELIRMIYGTLCFSIFFSFVGTVLGGLWADDSWGRFWGWDPKENGALIIVLWNALVLHARWGGLVKDRGLANLAMGGNIATAWSWFGVNELGVGLHSYGFTDGVLLALASICGLQLALIVLTAVVPLQSWWSFKQQRRDELNIQ
ncbi:MAG TPA: cytochrome c biogenesis protein CcsA, partial [Planctomycetaceae bacterium]|nr:cytochrome c biogenesis protein CcsA [Planctomycetaceae bacterium]